jgi:Tannase and feruloyl esterase
VDRVVNAKCDASDGVTDGLIQNPARCDFNPETDLPRCREGQRSAGQCFTQDQIDSLSIMISAITDPSGKVIYPAFSVSNLAHTETSQDGDLLSDWLYFPAVPHDREASNPWSDNPAGQPLSWYGVRQTIENYVYDGARDFNALTTPGIVFRKDRVGGTATFHAVIPQRTVALFNEKVKAGSGATPSDAARFIQGGRKLIVYHGYSDGDITPYRTIQYYRELARQQGGYEKLQKNAELFMVPGMAHCTGGPGPDSFGQQDAPIGPADDPQRNIVTALERWVEKGEQPKSLIATKYQRGSPAKSVVRSMPLCPYPAMARYSGSGDVNDATNWSCSQADHRLDETGPVGWRSGVYAPLN